MRLCVSTRWSDTAIALIYLRHHVPRLGQPLSMVATSANKTGWAKVQTLSAYAGYSKPDMLTAKYAKQASISQPNTQNAGRGRPEHQEPNGKNHQAPPDRWPGQAGEATEEQHNEGLPLPCRRQIENRRRERRVSAAASFAALTMKIGATTRLPITTASARPTPLSNR